jgi:hypothetical protein
MENWDKQNQDDRIFNDPDFDGAKELFCMDAIQGQDNKPNEQEPSFMDAEKYNLGLEPVTLRFINTVQSTEDFDDDVFGNPYQDISPKSPARSFHLAIDPNVFLDERRIYEILDNLDDQKLLGYIEPFDSLGYTIQSISKQVHG